MLPGPRIRIFEELVQNTTFWFPEEGSLLNAQQVLFPCHWALSKKPKPTHYNACELLGSSYLVLSSPFECDSIDTHDVSPHSSEICNSSFHNSTSRSIRSQSFSSDGSFFSLPAAHLLESHQLEIYHTINMSNSTSTSGDNDLYPYDPSKIGTLIAAGLFGITAFAHMFIMFSKRTWFYTAMVTGAFSSSPLLSQLNISLITQVMPCGYAARYLSAKKPDNLPLYVAQTLLILLPPSLYAATIYMIYGRIVLLVNAPDASVIGPGKVTKIFVTGDVISFLIQAAGGAMIAQAGHQDLGKKVVLTGLFCQLLFFGFFLIIAVIFDR